MRLDPTTLRLFLAVFDHGSIARAAEHEHIVPSAISRRIAELEAQLGTPLLVRRRDGIEPTLAGATLARHAREVLAALDRLPMQLAEFADVGETSIVLWSLTTAVCDGLLDELAAYRRGHPGLRIDLEERQSLAIVNGVAAGAADIGVVGHFQPEGRFVGLPYRDVPLHLVMRADHPLATRRSVSYVEAVEHDFVTLPVGTAIRAWLADAQARTGRGARLATQASTYEGVRAIVASGGALAVVPAPNIVPYAGALGLAFVPLADPWAVMHLWAIARSDCRPAVVHLLDALAKRTRTTGA